MWVASTSDQAWERPEGEMAFERYRLPTLIGQGGMGKVFAAAAAAIALAPFSMLAIYLEILVPTSMSPIIPERRTYTLRQSFIIVYTSYKVAKRLW